MKDKMKSFVKGLLLGLAGHPLPQAAEPVAYLYNGVRLPKLPQWDTVAYPYALIYSRPSVGDCFLHCSTEPAYVEGNYIVLPIQTLRAQSESENTEWGAFTDLEEIYQDGTTKWEINATSLPAIWTNTDILNADGSVHLAASDPVPVYE